MTEIILTFPVRRGASLSCVWKKTGNPAQPLVCKWSPRLKDSADPLAAVASESDSNRLCA